MDLGVRELNRRTVIVPLRAAQSLVGLPGGATNLDLTLVDVWAAQALADELSQRLPVQGRKLAAGNAQLVSALNAQSVSTALIRGVVMVVVVLGIASVLVVSVVQKRREIGILRAMGATRGPDPAGVPAAGRDRRRARLGAGRAAGGGADLGLHAASCAAPTGCRCSSITLAPALALRIAALATLCGVLAAVAPARRAAALDPAQAIRM